MKIKPLAFYLPQYHPIPENDEWWGKGFTEWTNVRKARQLYTGHYQPLIPAELGYYDLRIPSVLDSQVKLAKAYGVYGFIFYHYWFGNDKQLLERIPERMLESGNPDFPFCFCWANESWSGIWHGLDNKILVKQEYAGEDDVKKHIEYLAPFFRDDRYIKVNGAPVLMVYDPTYITNGTEYMDLYRKHAKKLGFPDLFLIGSSKSPDDISYREMGYDAHVSNKFHRSFNQEIRRWRYKWSFLSKWVGSYRGPARISAKRLFKDLKINEADVETYPMVLPNWDNTPRSGKRGIVLEGASPEIFETQLRNAKRYLEGKDNYQEKFLIIKSWNEWAEGNMLEPEQKFGLQYLQKVHDVLVRLDD